EPGERGLLLADRRRGTAQHRPADYQLVVREGAGDLLEQDEVDVAAQDADEADAPTRRARAPRARGRRRTREGASIDAVGRVEGVGVAPGVLRDQLRAHGQHRRRHFASAKSESPGLQAAGFSANTTGTRVASCRAT